MNNAVFIIHLKSPTYVTGRGDRLAVRSGRLVRTEKAWRPKVLRQQRGTVKLCRLAERKC